jgi:hypothetical protein
VKYYVLAFSISAAVAQSVSTTYITDVNGHRVDAGSVVTNDSQRTEVLQNLNGQRVPLRQTDERVLRKDGNSTVTERTIRLYDRNGRLASTERELIEEQKRPSGSTTHVTTYRSDVNGGMKETERRTSETDTQGSVTKTQSVIERPSIYGSFQTVEKRSGVTQTTATGSQSDETVYQPSQNGGFNVSARQVTETTREGNRTTETTALYQPLSSNGQLRLTEQTVALTTKRPDGSESVERTMYGSSWSGQAQENSSKPQVREQDVIERTPGPGGSVTESLSVRRVNPNDPGKLGAPQKISETICTGKCGRN